MRQADVIMSKWLSPWATLKELSAVTQGRRREGGREAKREAAEAKLQTRRGLVSPMT